jgi:predicted flap endonuclease-1-like 5' DNA nuclease
MDPTLVGAIIGVVLVIITIVLILWGFKKSEPAPVKSAPVAEKAASIPLKADDLVIIEGIGPKIAELLKKNGITTFAQLAAANVADLEKMLKAAGLQFAKPGSWPQQAALAAQGKMDELKALQEKLVAGR